MTKAIDLCQAMNQGLSSLRLSPEARQQVRSRAYGRARNRPKRLVFVLAVCLMLALLATATALTVQRSQNAQAIALARQELSRKYGLSARTLGVFDAQLTRRGGVATVVFQSQAFPAVLTGTYTVQVSQETVLASWSYDAVSPSVYASGALSAPVWGKKQLERALAEPEAAMPYQLAAMARSAASPSAAPASPPPDVARILRQEPGASYWNGKILRPALPGADDLSQGAAFSLACQALAEEFHLDEAVLRDARLLDASFSSRSSGGTLWGFSLYLVDQGVACDYGVMLDGKTGEILMTNVITGANE